MLEIVVVGAGIAGCSAALALWERGAAVTVVESQRPGAGATGASAGILAAQYETARGSDRLRICVEGRARFPEFAAKVEELAGRPLHLARCGLLVANQTADEHASAEATVAWQLEAGLAAELLDPGRALAIEPSLTSEALSFTWLRDEGRIDTQALAAALGAALARTDIRLITGNAAAEIEVDGPSVTGLKMTDGRRLAAERIVLAAGAWSGQVRGLPRPLRVRPVRGQMLRYPAGASALGHVVAAQAGRYLVPRADGTLLAGSTMEEAGFDRSITEAGRRDIHAEISRLVPSLTDVRPIEHWAGLRPVSNDSLPILGPDPDLFGLLYATGYGRDGILISPLAGEVVAELAISGETDFDWHPFRPDR